MLKKIWILFLGLVVFMGSACVTPTHASSASSVVLVYIQAASPISAKDEMVALYNNSSAEVNISNWCLKNKSNSTFGCFDTDTTFDYYLPRHSFLVVASESYITNTPPPVAIMKTLTTTNQSSGSIVNSNDTISLMNADGDVVDSYAWTTAIPSGKIATRSQSLVNPEEYETLDPLLSWSYQLPQQLPVTSVQARERQPVDPPETSPETELPDEEVGVLIHPIITELLPNPAGSDTGNEFIEFYNPGDKPINLNEYALRVGSAPEKKLTFPEGASIAPQEYSFFTNSQLPFTLLNTSSSVQLEYNAQPVDQPVHYEQPAEAESWSLFETGWQYTNVPTPGMGNQPSAVNAFEAATNVPKPCAANQYRSLETNRCRLIVTTAASLPQPCKEGQVRNPETNRCRLITSSNSEQTACKENQYRNPETNRCKNIVKMTKTEYGVKAVTSEQGPVNWYLWIGIAGIVTLIVGYGVWEWREELKKLLASLRQKFARSK